MRGRTNYNLYNGGPILTIGTPTLKAMRSLHRISPFWPTYIHTYIYIIYPDCNIYTACHLKKEFEIATPVFGDCYCKKSFRCLECFSS